MSIPRSVGKVRQCCSPPLPGHSGLSLWFLVHLLHVLGSLVRADSLTTTIGAPLTGRTGARPPLLATFDVDAIANGWGEVEVEAGGVMMSVIVGTTTCIGRLNGKATSAMR